MLLRLVVYADDERSFLDLRDKCIRVDNISGLVAYLERVLHRPPRVISYWNFERKQYELLTSLRSLLQPRSGDEIAYFSSATEPVSAHLWVETRSLRLEPVDPDVNAQEYAELRDHVSRLAGNAFISYSLQSALRVLNPGNELLFDYLRRARMTGDGERVELLYYAENSLGINDVLKRGFCQGKKNEWGYTPVDVLPLVSEGANSLPCFVFSSSLTEESDKKHFSTGPRKVLLCEVALGRTWRSDVSFSKNVATPPSGYDSVLYQEQTENGNVMKNVCVGGDYQALPRYLLTIVGKVGDGRKESYGGHHFNAAVSLTPATNEAGNVGNHLSVSRNVTPMRMPLKRSKMAPPPMGGRQARPNLLPSSLKCSTHDGTVLGVWCSTCNQAICPYCASVGTHKGHEVTNVGDVAGEMRRKVQDICRDLSLQMDNCRRVQSQVRAKRAELLEKHRTAVSELETTFDDLHNLIDAKKQEWLALLQEQACCLDEPLKEVSHVVEQYKEAILPLEQSWERTCEQCASFTDTGVGAPTTAASVVYIVEADKLLENGRRLFMQRQDNVLEHIVNAAERLCVDGSTLFQINCLAVRQCIEQIVPAKRSTSSGSPGAATVLHGEAHFSQLKTSPMVSANRTSPRQVYATSPLPLLLRRSGGTVDESPCDDSSIDTHDIARRRLLLQRLSDIRSGYMWFVHAASKYFHPEQRRAVCSGTFKLLGLEWDLRIQAPDTSVGCNSDGKQTEPSGEDELVGIFLFPVGHTLRLDFRVSIFSAVLWAEWRVSGWAVAFAGKGWGVYPLLPRRELMQTDRLAWGDTLKICVAPTSGVY